MRQRGGGNEGTIEDPNAMMNFILLPDSSQDVYGLSNRWLVDQHLRKPTLKCSVSLDVLPVLCQGRRANATQLAAWEERLEQVCCVHATAFSATARHDEVQLVDEKDDTWSTVLGSMFNFVQNRFDALFVFAFVLGAGHEGAHIERVEAGDETCRDVTVDNALCKAFGDGGLSNAGFTNKDGVVFCSESWRLQ